MVSFEFYKGVYQGSSIPEAEFFELAARAADQLERYKRIYTVAAPEADSEDMAICAMADALYFFDTTMNGGPVVSSTIGSVSSSYGTAGKVDVSPEAQAKELYRCACLYLDIYRGVG